MKLSIAMTLAASATCASAFTTTQRKTNNFALRMASEGADEAPAVESLAAPAEEPSAPVMMEAAPVAEATINKPSGPIMSQAMPFMKASPALDGSMVGDVGFDPLGFAQTEKDLFKYREAEIKHGRLAMLAAAGWPISELADRPIANFLGATPIVDATDRAPSLLNGGLSKISPVYWVACLLAAGAIDLIQNDKASKNADGYFAGNLGFDPLGLYPKDAEGQKRMQLAELKNGRLAMIAITAFAFQEFVTSIGVVDETPIFFKPIATVMHDYANAGYYIPN